MVGPTAFRAGCRCQSSIRGESELGRVEPTRVSLIAKQGCAFCVSRLRFEDNCRGSRCLQHLQGVIVVLSADGRLEACYLGSEPSLFVAPPLHPRGYDYTAAEQELAELRALSRKSKDSGETTARLYDTTATRFLR